MAVDAVQGTGLQFVDNLQTGNDKAAFPFHFLFQEPAGSVVHEGYLLGNVPQGGNVIAAGIAQTLYQGLGTDVVVADGELVGPALEGVFHIAVNHHVFGQFFQVHPLADVAFQGFFNITVQQVHTLFHLLAQFHCGRFYIGPAGFGKEGSHQGQCGRRHQRHGHPVPYEVLFIHDGRALPLRW